MYLKELFSPKHLFFKTLFFILFSCIIITTSYSLYRSSKPYQGVTNSMPISPTLAPYRYPTPSYSGNRFKVIIPDFWTESQEIESRIGWKTYSNNEYSFLYPPEWHVFSCKTYTDGPLTVYVSPQVTTCTQVGLHKTLFYIDSQNIGFKVLNDYHPDKTSNISVGGQEGIVGLKVEPDVENLAQVLSPYLLEMVIIPYKDKYYEFNLKIHEDPDLNVEKTFHRILFTFKFKH